MVDLGVLKLLGYGAIITYVSLTGGGSYHGVSVRPCTELLCSRPSSPPIGSYWVYRNGKYLAAYNGRIWPGQKQLAGIFH